MKIIILRGSIYVIVQVYSAGRRRRASVAARMASREGVDREVRAVVWVDLLFFGEVRSV